MARTKLFGKLNGNLYKPKLFLDYEVYVGLSNFMETHLRVGSLPQL